MSDVGFVNCIPVFIASNESWSKRFLDKNLPIIGDDIQSQFGATALHRNLTEIMTSRGVNITNTYQINFGGNSDFFNMLDYQRLESKKISKTQAVTSQIKHSFDENNVHIGPSDFIEALNDTKVCHIRTEGTIFGNNHIEIDIKLKTQDSPNAAGVIVDAIRICKSALDKNEGGPIEFACQKLMKSPPNQTEASSAESSFAKQTNSE